MAQSKNNTPVLSVIIPCYNCAPVIVRCLDSIDYPDCEIIVVNDGSTDNSSEVVKQYAETHPYVRIIQQPNAGPAAARNTGIPDAKGKYIEFIDADDYLVPGGIPRLVALAEKEQADVVKFRVRSVYEGQKQVKDTLAMVPLAEKIFEGQGEALHHILVSDYHVIDAIFRRDVIMENNIRFRTDMFLREDDVFMCELYCRTTRVIQTELPIYCYVRSSNYSSTTKGGKPKIDKLNHSELQAIRYRKAAVERIGGHRAFPLEKYKYMRYALGCQNTLIKSGYYTFDEYRKWLQAFKAEGAWPVKYHTLQVMQYGYSLKWCFKVFLCNHLRLAWLSKKLYH